MYDLKGFHGESLGGQQTGERPWKDIQGYSLYKWHIFFLISVAILAHGHMSLQEHLRDIIFLYVQKREIDLPLTTWASYCYFL